MSDINGPLLTVSRLRNWNVRDLFDVLTATAITTVLPSRSSSRRVRFSSALSKCVANDFVLTDDPSNSVPNQGISTAPLRRTESVVWQRAAARAFRRENRSRADVSTSGFSKTPRKLIRRSINRLTAVAFGKSLMRPRIDR